MSVTFAELGPMLALILVGFLPNEVWRLLGLVSGARPRRDARR